MKKTPQDIHPRNKCAKFQLNRTIFEASRLLLSFSLVLAKNLSPGPKNQNFWKMKKIPPDIHPRTKCAKFQPNPTIFEVSRLPQSFSAKISLFWLKKLVPRPQKSKFLKNEKNTPRYSPKEQVCEISAKSDNFWSLQRAPKFWDIHLELLKECHINQWSKQRFSWGFTHQATIVAIILGKKGKFPQIFKTTNDLEVL